MNRTRALIICTHPSDYAHARVREAAKHLLAQEGISEEEKRLADEALKTCSRQRSPRHKGPRRSLLLSQMRVERTIGVMPAQPLLPARIGPAEFAPFGSMVAIRCPEDLAPLLRKAGAMWEPGGKRWLVHRSRLGPLMRNLRRDTDPLFRRAGINLDGEK